MNQFGFKVDQKITDFLAVKKSFTLSAEVIPPRNGAEQSAVMSQIEALVKSGAQFLSVTKGAGGSLRGGSLPIAQVIKDQLNVPCIAHFTCRDLSPEEVENSLIDHHYFGIRNILALRGDPPTDDLGYKPKSGSYSYAHQLISQIQNLNKGEFLKRQTASEVSQQSTDFCIGAAVYPEHPDKKECVDFLKAKVDAGAQYAITQMLFDSEIYARTIETFQKNKIFIPILPGTRFLNSEKMALKMAERFQVSMPKDLSGRLKSGEDSDPLAAGVDLFFDFVQKLKSYGAPGVHLFVLSETKGSCELLKRLAGLKDS